MEKYMDMNTDMDMSIDMNMAMDINKDMDMGMGWTLAWTYKYMVMQIELRNGTWT
jgi:hypothetical protein